MIALLSVAVLCLVQWGTSRKIKNLILGLIFVLLCAGCYLLDQMVHTPREIITQNVYELTSAFQHQDKPKTLSFFSAQAIAERAVINLAFDQVHVGDDLRITDLSVAFKAANSLAISHFRANASISLNMSVVSGDFGHHPSRWELDWQQEAGEWKVVKVHRLHPITGKELGIMAAD